MSSDSPPGAAVGAERNETAIEDCRTRLGEIPGLSFANVETGRSAGEEGGFDAVFCMEVLERILDLDTVFEHLDALLAPEGRLIVSIPVGTGLPLILKQMARRAVGLRGIHGYVGHSGYTWKELFTALTAGPDTRIPRIIHGESGPDRSYDHKGFNWLAMRKAIAEKLALERTLSSPFQWLPPGMGGQVWMAARKRSAP